jgi:hypothetical protein
MFKGNCCTDKGERRGPRFIGRIVGGIALAVVFALVFSIFVQMLWNWLMPTIFHLGTITWEQAFGLLLLARLIFGSMGHHGRNHHAFGKGKHGFHGLGWCGCGGAKEDAANGDIEDWQHYDAWWNAEGRDAFRKYAENQASGKGGDDSK